MRPENLHETSDLSTWNTIDLWFAEPESINSAVLLDAYRALLSDDELECASQFYFARDRHSYLITRALVRTVLSNLLGVAANTLRFAANQYGRPYLLHDGGLSFSISHTAGMIVVATSRSGEIGVDLESRETSRATNILAERCFAPGEIVAFRSIAPSHADETFLSIWTLKEAYIKARGTGLSLPLKSFQFDLTNSGSIDFLPPAHSPAGPLPSFWLLQPGPSHLCAVCALYDQRRVLPKARYVVPLISETPFDIPVLRSSVPPFSVENA
ncbi:4'-phosphopantetheinyl transferase superfamily protein [Paraburkholderia jirisanensis]